jgi:hypothetical protein
MFIKNLTENSPLPNLLSELKGDNIKLNIELINHILKGINENL